jgi:hypothetical protein
VWIANDSGIACYSLADETWKGFTGEEWRRPCTVRTAKVSVIALSSNDRFVLTGHARGVAAHEVDGVEYSVSEPKDLGNASRCCCSHIVPIPDSDDFLCVLEHDGRGGLYTFDGKNRLLRKRFDLMQPITTMAFSEPSRLWVAVVGTIYELDLTTNSVVQQHSFAVDAVDEGTSKREENERQHVD